jgi:hypothetical protein
LGHNPLQPPQAAMNSTLKHKQHHQEKKKKNCKGDEGKEK